MMQEIRVRTARPEEADRIQGILRSFRRVFGFVPVPAIEESARRNEMVLSVSGDSIVGLARFHHRRDKVTTLHEIAVQQDAQGQGIGQCLLEQVEQEGAELGQRKLRLKCPIDVPANGFYAHLGFQRIRIEKGRRRPLAVWEKRLSCETAHLASSSPAFFLTLTNGAHHLRKVIRLWDEGGDLRNPFAQVIFTPLFSSSSSVATIRQLTQERGSVTMFDSGGYQVQMGRATYEELFDSLLHFYKENDWADWYVLPDHVPHSTDTEREVAYKVRETLDFARLFLRMMPDGFASRAIGVVHGREEEQVFHCVESYARMGLRYIGFGSFGTSGPKAGVNMVSRRSLRLLRLVQRLAREHGLDLHIFGIGSPRQLSRLADAGIRPTSFDSSGWWKAAGFGKVFFPAGAQLHITRMDGYRSTQRGVQREKDRARHRCPFCADFAALRRNRSMRVMHNLVAMLETVERYSGS